MRMIRSLRRTPTRRLGDGEAWVYNRRSFTSVDFDIIPKVLTVTAYGYFHYDEFDRVRK